MPNVTVSLSNYRFNRSRSTTWKSKFKCSSPLTLGETLLTKQSEDLVCNLRRPLPRPNSITKQLILNIKQWSQVRRISTCHLTRAHQLSQMDFRGRISSLWSKYIHLRSICSVRKTKLRWHLLLAMLRQDEHLRSRRMSGTIYRYLL